MRASAGTGQLRMAARPRLAYERRQVQRRPQRKQRVLSSHLLYVWGPGREQPDPCTTLDNGMRACMPIIVMPPPLWAYFAFACGGAIVALLVAAAALHFRRQLP